MKYRLSTGIECWRATEETWANQQKIITTKVAIFDENDILWSETIVDSYYTFKLPKSAAPWILIQVWSKDIEKVVE